MPVRKLLERATNRMAETDSAIRRFVLPYRAHPLVQALGLASEVADQPQLRLLSGAFIVAGFARSDDRLVRAGTRMLLAHELATLLKNLVKDEVDRTRPRNAASREEQKPKPGRSSSKEETSFPSGHTAGAVAVARALSREFPEHRSAAFAAAGLVAAAQVPRCAHYVSDVGVGAFVGLAAEALSSLLGPRNGRS